MLRNSKNWLLVSSIFLVFFLFFLLIPKNALAGCTCYEGQHGTPFQAGCGCGGATCTYEFGPPTNNWIQCTSDQGNPQEARDCACGGGGVPGSACANNNGACGPRVEWHASINNWDYYARSTSPYSSGCLGGDTKCVWGWRPFRAVPGDRCSGSNLNSSCNNSSCNPNNSGDIHYTGGGNEYPTYSCGWGRGDCSVCYTEWWDFCEQITDQNQCNSAQDANLFPCKWYTRQECGPQHANLGGNFYPYVCNQVTHTNSANCYLNPSEPPYCTGTYTGQGYCNTICSYLGSPNDYIARSSCYVAPPASCTVSLSPKPASMQTGSTLNFFASVVPSNGNVDQVNFLSSNTAVATVNPGSDTSSAYQTLATGVSAGTATITANVIMGGVQRCTDTSTLTVTPTSPWWQVKDADVITSGAIQSTIPSASLYFGLNGLGGYHGIPTYGTTSSFGSGTVSQAPAWLANTTTNYRKTYNYAFFKSQIPSDVQTNMAEITSTSISSLSGTTPTRGYEWYHFNGSLGDLTITSNLSLGSRKVILLVDGADLNINGKINLTKGSGFFLAVIGKNSVGAKGNIVVGPSVAGSPSLEGIYLSENQFKTGVGAVQFNIRGAVAAYGGVVLERNLGASNSTTPAEVFEYAPDLMVLYPNIFTDRRIRWKEVAP